MNKKIIILLASSLSMYAGEVKLDEISVTAQRSEQNLDEISRSISVIDNKTLTETMSSNLPEVLAQTPGVSYAPDGMISGQIILRGFSSQNLKVPLFVNGDRFRGRNTMEYLYFDPTQIERVEIIRGPASSLYGTDSFGGVVNVVTKKASGDVYAPFSFSDTYLSTQFQTANHGFNNRMQLGGAGDGIDIILGLNYKFGKNYNTPDGYIPNSDFLYRGIDLRAGYNFSDSQRIGIVAKYATVERGRSGGQFAAPGAGNAPGALQRQMREIPINEKYIALEYEGNIYDTNLDASLYRREFYTRINVYPNLNIPTKFVDNFVIGPVVYGGRALAKTPFENFTATYGVDFYYEDRAGGEQSKSGGEKFKSGPSSTQLNIAGFGLLEYSFENGTILSGSLRHDYFNTSLETSFIKNDEIRDLFENVGDTITNKTTGGVGVILPIASSDFNVVGNINTSFRAPSTTEMVAVGDGVSGKFTIPNSSLKPETGVTYEGGFRYHDENILSNLTFFTSSYRNLMLTQNITYNGHPARQLRNVSESKISGIEFDIAYKILSELSFKTNVSYLYGEDKTLNKPLPQIMPLNGFLSLRYKPRYFSNSYLEYTNQWALKRTRVYENTERPRDGFDVSNIYFGKQIGKVSAFRNIELNFGIENVFNTKYSMPTVPEDIAYLVSKTNPLLNPGRNFKIGLRAFF